MDEVLEELRDALREEHDVLLNNCEYLRELLEEEMSYNARTSSFRVPTVRELSDLAAKLEEEDQQLAHEMKVNSLPDVGPRSGPSPACPRRCLPLPMRRSSGRPFQTDSPPHPPPTRSTARATARLRDGRPPE